MDNIPREYKALIRENKEIELEGIRFYPIKVRELDELNAVRAAVEVMQSRFPVRYAVMPLLQALYAMDYDAVISGASPVGLFAQTVLFLALCLRHKADCPHNDRIAENGLQILCDSEEPRKLKGLYFFEDGGEPILITPAIYGKIRPILAAMNGLEVPDENDNPDLIDADNEARGGGYGLHVNMDDLLASMAVVTHRRQSEYLDWTAREFYLEKAAIDRDKNYFKCSIGEMSGQISWKGGNPCPSWCFDRLHGNAGLTAFSEFEKKAAGSGGLISNSMPPTK